MNIRRILTIGFIISVIAMIVATGSFVRYGLLFGVDFTGGTVMEISFENERPDVATMQAVLTGRADAPWASATVTPANDAGMIIRTGPLTEAEHQLLLQALQKGLPQHPFVEDKFDSIGPTIGGELKTKSIQAIVIVLVLVGLYIAWVFRRVGPVLSSWTMAFATLVGLLHDLIIPVGVFAYLGHAAHVEIGAVFVAALLTVLGYSISDTVVVFDRVRENIIRSNGRSSLEEIIPLSIRQTLVRSLNTTLTTLLSLFAVYFFGGESVKYFALALILGIGLGAYSSVFVASPLLLWLSPRKR
ncbi:MAG: protein translocase subunit SecF [Candidatus Paceibacterota bacterium]|nr:MAG: protein translocase subunit SecF [Candidatus Paceibacterota bacterium]